MAQYPLPHIHYGIVGPNPSSGTLVTLSMSLRTFLAPISPPQQPSDVHSHRRKMLRVHFPQHSAYISALSYSRMNRYGRDGDGPRRTVKWLFPRLSPDEWVDRPRFKMFTDIASTCEICCEICHTKYRHKSHTTGVGIS